MKVRETYLESLRLFVAVKTFSQTRIKKKTQLDYKYTMENIGTLRIKA